MIDSSKLCNKHLLGEHLECHMFVGALNKRTSVQGFISNGLLEIHSLKNRHEDLVEEMLHRGMIHNSNLPAFEEKVLGRVDVNLNEEILRTRCKRCFGGKNETKLCK